MLNAHIVGNIGRDPEMRYTAGGEALLRFTVASNYRERDSEGEWQDRVEWVRVTVFGKRAETLAEYLKKGTKVYAHGQLKARPWADQEGGLRAGLELTANEVEFMSSREGGQQAERPSGQPSRPRQQRPAEAEEDAGADALPW